MFPLEQTRHVGVAKIERPRLTNGEIIFEEFQHGGGRHLGFVRTVNSAIRSADPENPTLEPNMKWIG